MVDWERSGDDGEFIQNREKKLSWEKKDLYNEKKRKLLHRRLKKEAEAGQWLIW